ncbi:MAG: YggS family pyridoxal phosphate-dependent enzyme [Bacteroidales bacterium]|nr:YggS family pyridoxal phosphate-dependent enzyme [Bacteroidales bacterium]MCB9013263.1 YggS family pyridoxal phosphate-dependent enzyme [Bacteroidales bacterium]
MELSDYDIREFISSLPKGITLVAVSKTKPVEEILRVYHAGHKIFGENRVQELSSKYEQLPKDIQWHQIGHLQSNKVKYIAPFVSMIHSIDSFKILRIVEQEAKKSDRVIDILLQVYIAEEESKFGLDRDEVLEILNSKEFYELQNIRLRGLMGIATYTENREQVRKEFRQLHEFFLKCKSEYFAGNSSFSELSMGMSGDYQIAIEEGATIIRLGSIIFGERNYL